MRCFATRRSLLGLCTTARSASSFEPAAGDVAAASAPPTASSGGSAGNTPPSPAADAARGPSASGRADYAGDVNPTAKPAASDKVSSMYYAPEMEGNAALKEKVVQFLLSRDKELFNLKRQHELALLRIEQGQDRILKEEQDIDCYREHAINCNTFEEVSVAHYTKRGTWYQLTNVADLRKFKVALWLFITAIVWAFLYNKYVLNPEKEYIANNPTLFGSNYGSMKQRRDAMELEQEFKVRAV